MEQEVVIGIVKKDNKVLMVKRAKTEGNLVWAFPGGKVETGETKEQACIREIKEETGITVSIIKEIGSRFHPNTARRITYFLCKYIEGELITGDTSEILEVTFKSKEEFEKDVATDVFPAVLMELNW